MLLRYFYFVSDVGFAAWASRIPLIQHCLRLNGAQVESILLALPAGLMLTRPVTSQLLQRFSRRHVMMTGAALCNVALALLRFTPSRLRK